MLKFYTFGVLSVVLCFYPSEVHPEITLVSGNLEKVGTSVTLECRGQSADVTWSKDGETLSLENSHYSFVNQSLTINKAGESDIGVYVCNADGKNYDVNLFAKPRVTLTPKRSENVVEGKPLELKCDVWGHPTPDVEWRVLKLGDEVDMELTNSSGRLNFTSGMLKHSVLSISSVELSDYADYKCVATNSNGTTEGTVKVRVKGKLAPLWPFLGIILEAIILAAIIIVYEMYRAKHADDDTKEEAKPITNANDHPKDT